MNHPTAGRDQNHKHSEHTQSTSGVKVNDPKSKNKDTESVQNISGVQNNDSDAHKSVSQIPFFTLVCYKFVTPTYRS